MPSRSAEKDPKAAALPEEKFDDAFEIGKVGRGPRMRFRENARLITGEFLIFPLQPDDQQFADGGKLALEMRGSRAPPAENRHPAAEDIGEELIEARRS